MLNDRVRNSKFEKAIENRVKNGCDTVLDVGTGTGLLRYVPYVKSNRMSVCSV